MKKLSFLFLALTILLQSCYTYSSLKTPKDQKQLTIQEQIKPEQIYKIEVDNKTYTIKAIQWEQDSLVAQTSLKKDIKKKFSTKHITNVRERKFSDTRSNILTVISYIAAGTGIVFLINKL